MSYTDDGAHACEQGLSWVIRGWCNPCHMWVMWSPLHPWGHEALLPEGLSAPAWSLESGSISLIVAEIITASPSQNGYHQCDNRCCGECGEKGTLIQCGERQINTAIVGIWRFFKKIEIRTTVWLSYFTSRQKTPYSTHRDICTSIFIVALLTILKIWNQTSCVSTDKWILKTFSVYIKWNTLHLKEI